MNTYTVSFTINGPVNANHARAAAIGMFLRGSRPTDLTVTPVDGSSDDEFIDHGAHVRIDSLNRALQRTMERAGDDHDRWSRALDQERRSRLSADERLRGLMTSNDRVVGNRIDAVRDAGIDAEREAQMAVDNVDAKVTALCELLGVRLDEADHPAHPDLPAWEASWDGDEASDDELNTLFPPGRWAVDESGMVRPE